MPVFAGCLWTVFFFRPPAAWGGAACHAAAACGAVVFFGHARPPVLPGPAVLRPAPGSAWFLRFFGTRQSALRQIRAAGIAFFGPDILLD